MNFTEYRARFCPSLLYALLYYIRYHMRFLPLLIKRSRQLRHWKCFARFLPFLIVGSLWLRHWKCCAEGVHRAYQAIYFYHARSLPHLMRSAYVIESVVQKVYIGQIKTYIIFGLLTMLSLWLRHWSCGAKDIHWKYQAIHYIRYHTRFLPLLIRRSLRLRHWMCCAMFLHLLIIHWKCCAEGVHRA